jgi:hypothetical protein
MCCSTFLCLPLQSNTYSYLPFLLDVDIIAIRNNLFETTKDPKAGEYVGQFWILAEEVVEAMANHYGDRPCISFAIGPPTNKTRVLPGVIPYFHDLLEVRKDWMIGLSLAGGITAGLDDHNFYAVVQEVSELFGALPLQHVDLSEWALKDHILLLLPLLKSGLKTLILLECTVEAEPFVVLVDHLMTPNQQGISPARSLVSLNLENNRGGLKGAMRLAQMFPLCENLEYLNIKKW